MEESGNKLEPFDNRNNTSLLPIESLIHVIRGQQVMIDSTWPDYMAWKLND